MSWSVMSMVRYIHGPLCHGLPDFGQTYSFWLSAVCPCGWKSLTIIPICRVFSTNRSSCSSNASNLSVMMMSAFRFLHNTPEVIKVSYGQNVPKSKRTHFGQNVPEGISQNVPYRWSKRTQPLVKTYPTSGQNVPNLWSKRTHPLVNRGKHKIRTSMILYGL